MRPKILGVVIGTLALACVPLLAWAIPIGSNAHPPSIWPTAAPNPADASVTLSVDGGLSWSMNYCATHSPGQDDEIYGSYIAGEAYWIVGPGAQILDGPFAGQSIPLTQVLSAQDGDCGTGPGGIQNGHAATFTGSKSFSTASLADGSYTSNIKITDDIGGSATAPVTFTVTHGQPPGSQVNAWCTGGPDPSDVGAQVSWNGHLAASDGSNVNYADYTYSWSGTDGLSGTSRNVTKTYGTGGTKNATLVVRNRTDSSWQRSVNCSIHVNPPIGGGDLLSCNVGDSTSTEGTVAVNQNISFKVNQGAIHNPFSWSASLGDPNSGGGNVDYVFTTKFRTAGGPYAVTVTESGQNPRSATCNVTVTDPNCTTPSTITVRSDVPATWTLNGPNGTQRQATPASQATYQTQPQGSYTLVPDAMSGTTSYTVNPAAAQSIASCGQNLAFDIHYNAGESGAFLEIVPSYREIQTGEIAYLNAYYHPAGATGPSQVVTVASTWSSASPAIASYGGTGSGEAAFHGASVGSADVTAAYNGLTAHATVAVVTQPSCISAGMSANPDMGPVPLSSLLRVSASALDGDGTYNYTIWANCNYGGTNVQTAQNQCGPWIDKADGVSAATHSTVHSYSPAGFYVAFAIVEHNGCAVNAGAAVVAQTATTTHLACVNNSCTSVAGAGPDSCLQEGWTCQSPPQTHLACVNNACTVINSPGIDSCSPAGSACGTAMQHSECVNSACVNVSGAGPNRCGTSSDCGDDSSGEDPFHSVCDPVQRACVNRVCPGGSSCTSTCASDPACGYTGTSHLECQNNSCVIFGGPGSSSCTVVGSQCTTVPPGGTKTCTFSASPFLILQGDSSTLKWNCLNISSCTVTSQTLQPSILASGGPVGQVDTPALATSTAYKLSCDSGAFTTTTLVRVKQQSECNPGDPTCNP